MASVTFPPALGGDGSTVTDDANVTTGLANGGHRARFVPSLSQAVTCMSGAVSQATTQVGLATTQASNALASANSASASAASALSAATTNATSTSSIALGGGSKSLTLAQTGKGFVVGQFVSIADATTPTTKWMLGAITAFTTGTGAMTVSVTTSAGSGSGANWVIAASAPVVTQSTLSAPQVDNTGTVSVSVGADWTLTYAAGVTTATLPLTPSVGDIFCIDNNTGRYDVLLSRNGSNVMGLAEDHTLDKLGSFTFKYISAAQGWRYR